MDICVGKSKNFRVSIPLGLLSVISCEKGLHEIKFKLFDVSCNSEIQVLDESPPAPLFELKQYLERYFSKLPLSDLKEYICWSKVYRRGSFSEKVLKKLFEIKFGEKISYKNLAKLSGNPNSQRAVGSVMRKNPICLVIPCHRVINSNRKIGKYTGGVEIKKWLLEFEEIQ